MWKVVFLYILLKLWVCLCVTRQGINLFAPDWHAYALKQAGHFRKVNSPKVSWVRIPVRVVSVAV
jgi:hypothetical protein